MRRPKFIGFWAEKYLEEATRLRCFRLDDTLKKEGYVRLPGVFLTSNPLKIVEYLEILTLIPTRNRTNFLDVQSNLIEKD